jgi:hypothetical protein
MSGLQPTAGARFLLERDGDPGDAVRATYRATIYTPDAEHAGRAVLGDDGSVELAPTGAPAPLDAALAMFAKLTARGAGKRREDGLPTWPARVLRWRPDKA